MSRYTNIPGIIVVVTILVTLFVSLGNVSVIGQVQGTADRWEYAVFIVKNGKPTLVQSAQELEVNPPLGSSGNAHTQGGREVSRYTTSSRQVQNNMIASLNLFGSLGWEVVSVLSSDGEPAMLMKRRY